MAALSPDQQAILHTIEAWPIEEQVSLARSILARTSIDTTTTPANRKRSTWDALYKLASDEQSAPSDEQVAQRLDERRMEKYGQ
jgi:hypothetical protein